jgi:putative CocE/NonD family hydrolase
MNRMPTRLLIAFLCCGVAANAQPREDSLWLRGHYQKLEQSIPMRDGIRLFTAIYTPRDTTHGHPILLMRTPYSCSPYGTEDWWPALWLSYFKHYVRKGYCLVLQDVRGRYESEGSFVDVRPFIADKKTPQDIDEASDTYDTIDWLLKNNPGNNGRVGVMGISYPGFYAAMAALSNHPALKAVSPQAPVTDWFAGDDLHHNGAFFLQDAFAFFVLNGFGDPRPTPTLYPGRGMDQTDDDSYRYFLGIGALPNFTRLTGDTVAFWRSLMDHPDYDAWWQARNDRQFMSRINPETATLIVGGLFDAEDCYGAWRLYQAIGQMAHNDNKLVMGPWYHGQWSGSTSGSQLGDLNFGSNTGDWYKEHIEIPFFDSHLVTGGKDDLPKATVFFTGENRWKKFTQWPPDSKTSTLYLDSAHLLSTTAPIAGADSYRSDPADPVPYTKGKHATRTREYMDGDQRFAAARKDVLVYQTPALTRDLTVAGPFTADLWVSISTTDADFVVKLIDVFPGDQPDAAPRRPRLTADLPDRDSALAGYQMLVRGDIFRGRYRNSLSAPVPFVPGQPTEVKFDLNDIAHTFRKGHRIMVQVQSSWFPLADRNPQQFVNIYQAKDADFIPADISVWHDAAHPSRILLPVLR